MLINPWRVFLCKDGLRQRHLRKAAKADEWLTPPVIIDAARTTMGCIDLDVASSAEANKSVQAKHYLTAEQDGLSMPWTGNIWCNPPIRGEQTSRWVGRCLAHSQPVCLLVTQGDTEGTTLRLLEEADAICWIQHLLSSPTGGHSRQNTFEDHPLLDAKRMVVAMLRCEPKGDEWAGIGPVRYRRPQPITGSDRAAGC